MADLCAKCGAALDPLRVCTDCGHLAPLTAAQRIEQLADRGSFREIDRHLWSGNPLHFTDGVSSYEMQVAEAQAETHLLDAVVTGRARVLSARVVLVVFDFRFLGGSMGSVVGEKVGRAFDVARRERLPAIVICSSGGARIQEGMIALFSGRYGLKMPADVEIDVGSPRHIVAPSTFRRATEEHNGCG